MYIFRLNPKRISLWILFLTQIIVISSYFLLRSVPEDTKPTDKISFPRSNEINIPEEITYHTIKDKIDLKTVSTSEYFIDFNSSLCFMIGTDLKLMRSTKELNWQCECLPGWHGIDCGQPEVLLRALLAHKKVTKLKGPRASQRRLIYLTEVDKFNEYTADIRINELGDIIDLFILYESDGDYIQHKLNNKFCQDYHHKILYVQGKKENIWKTVQPLLNNLKKDDIIITSNANEIPNRNALVFLKFYDNLPELITFRLRWSVFGFFWTHPSKTVITGGACSISYLKENFNNQPNLLLANRTSSLFNKGIILGDLNHTGGWFCEYCNDAAQIVQYLANKTKNVIDWNKISKHKIDMTFIEDLIENGMYIDGKTELVRAHKYSDNYFAPVFVLEHDWKYDFLLINFYSKMDYYES